MEKFAELIIDVCKDAVMEADESPKMILHEPYRSIVASIDEKFE